MDTVFMPDTTASQPPVLLIDDDPLIVQSSKLLLRAAGIKAVMTLSDSREVLPLLNQQVISVLVVDLQMPHISGQALLTQVKNEFPDIPIIISTANDELDTAVQCMQLGAFDYLVKPVEKSRLTSSIARAMELRSLQGEVSSLKSRLLDDKLTQPSAFETIITCEAKIRSLFQYIEAIAPSDQPVLVTGETGTGKELFATAIHDASGRTGKFVAVNVAGLDDAMFSDTLFGHEKGAFTGAERNRQGLIAQAANGTLFLDEIGDLERSTQVKLLRLLQDNSYSYVIGNISLENQLIVK